VELCPAVADKIIDLPNGVHVAEFGRPLARPAEMPAELQPRNYILYLGRLVERKGVHVLLQGLAKIRHDKPTLVIAGDGPQRLELEQLAARLNLTRHVRFLGTVKGTLRTYLLQHALFVVAPTTTWEGQPLTVLESFAAGQPVLGSNVPGIRDTITPGESGWLVPPNDPAALADNLSSILSEEGQLARFRTHVRQIAARHDWPLIAEEHLRIYARLQANAGEQTTTRARTRNVA
jgi:glycosyltransferase involved in cell wall biosynthesis